MPRHTTMLIAPGWVCLDSPREGGRRVSPSVPCRGGFSRRLDDGRGGAWSRGTGGNGDGDSARRGQRSVRDRAGGDGNLWFTTLAAGYIGRVTPAGTVTQFPAACPATAPARDRGGPGRQPLVHRRRRTDRPHHPDRDRDATSPRGRRPLRNRARAGRQPVVHELRRRRIGRITPAGAATFFTGQRGTASTTSSPARTATSGSPSTECDQIGRITPTGTVTEFPARGRQPAVRDRAGPGRQPLVRRARRRPHRPDHADRHRDPVLRRHHAGKRAAADRGRPGRQPVVHRARRQPDRPDHADRHRDGVPACRPPAASHGITAGPDGAMWFTQRARGRIGRIEVTPTPPRRRRRRPPRRRRQPRRRRRPRRPRRPRRRRRRPPRRPRRPRPRRRYAHGDSDRDPDGRPAGADAGRGGADQPHRHAAAARDLRGADRRTRRVSSVQVRTGSVAFTQYAAAAGRLRWTLDVSFYLPGRQGSGRRPRAKCTPRGSS